MKDISVMIGEVKFNFRVGVVIQNNGRVLLERGNKVDFSVTPGGRIQTLETVKQALIREIQEELEVDISREEITFLSIIENFFVYENSKVHELYYVYKVNLKEDNVLTQKDNFINKDSNDSVYNWVNIDELDSVKILPDGLKDVIKSNEFSTVVVNEINKNV